MSNKSHQISFHATFLKDKYHILALMLFKSFIYLIYCDKCHLNKVLNHYQFLNCRRVYVSKMSSNCYVYLNSLIYKAYGTLSDVELYFHFIILDHKNTTSDTTSQNIFESKYKTPYFSDYFFGVFSRWHIKGIVIY